MTYKLKSLPNSKYEKGLRDEINEHGLKGSIEKRLEEINEMCVTMNYTQKSLIGEMGVEILDLIDVFAKYQVFLDGSDQDPKQDETKGDEE